MLIAADLGASEEVLNVCRVLPRLAHNKVGPQEGQDPADHDVSKQELDEANEELSLADFISEKAENDGAEAYFKL